MTEHPDDQLSPDQEEDIAAPPAQSDSAAGSEKLASIDHERIKRKIERAYQLVPPIGSGWRWYDVPYRLFHWLLTSWRRRLIPWRMRRFINKGMNFFMAFEHYERLKVEPLDDPLENLIVPEGEKVTQGGVWVVEMFPPSRYAALQQSLSRNGWDSENRFSRPDGTNAEQVMKARRGRGFLWSRIGTVANPNAKFVVFGAKREVLPQEFDLVDLTAVQIGRSLTAVVAFVRFSEIGQQALNRVWTAQHEPTLEWRGLRRPHVEGRNFAAIQETQSERQRLHDVARSWLADRCGGYFADSPLGQPVIDFNVFAQHDPTAVREGRHRGEALRALAMEGDFVRNYVSPQVPGAVFTPADSIGRRVDPLRNSWGVVGSYDRMNEVNDRVGYGKKPYSVEVLAAMFDDAVRAFLLHVAVLRYAEDLSATYAAARDEARDRHGKFSARRLEQLRSELLTTSLDLPVVARDSAALWEVGWRRFNGVQVNAEPAPGAHAPAPETFDLIEYLGKQREERFSELVKEDADYREVLSTVSSLGASAEASRLGRRALITALGSLLVALVTLLVANTGDETLWSELVEWVQR